MSYYDPAMVGQQTPDKTVDGMLVGVEPKQGGWMKFKVQADGMQYPVTVDTKLEPLVNAAMALLGKPVSARYSERQSENINPNSGRPYINRTLQAIGPRGSMVQDGQQQAGGYGQQAQGGFVQQQQPQIEPGAQGRRKDIEIARQSAMKCAVQFLPFLTSEQRTLGAMITIADDLVRYFLSEPQPTAVHGGQEAWDDYGNPMPGDDDIPFG